MTEYKQCSYSFRKSIKQGKRHVQRQSGVAIQQLRRKTYVAGDTGNHGLQKENQTRRGPGCLAPRQTKQLLARFEDNIVLLTRPATKTCGLFFTAADVSKTFKLVKPRKAAGPDGIPSRVLRAFADQLAGVCTDIFNQSLSQSAVPT